jgi:archaellum component FlaC
MKKIFAFLKSFFVKVDKLEDKVENFVDKTNMLSAEQKKKVKKTLDEVDRIGENIEDVVVKAEVAHDKVSKIVKSKDITKMGEAIDSVKDVVKEAKEVKTDATTVIKKVKTIKKK